MEENTTTIIPKADTDDKSSGFKKPIFTGRVGKLPKKITSPSEEIATPELNKTTSHSPDPKEERTDQILTFDKELTTSNIYKEPKWSGLCPDGSEYALEVLKSGIILEKINLTNKPYYVFGRLADCDVVMAHPTISRYHAVIQYKAFAEDGEPSSGWYLYDLNSTHGTFLNKDRLKDNHYTRVKVGHQIKFGNSTRTYVMLGPDFDCEGESELTVTEIKERARQMKVERDKIIKEALEQREKDRLEEERKKEEQGIDWGMGEDAEEEPDLADNPYAATGNEELYLEDPKKTLRGYYEREGLELSYDCEERGVGQFLCRVELPIDDARGKPVIAEVIHRGKKKEAVIACALEACRILDRAGLLRQAKHESRRRKERDWSADDYYDSDDDTFLDRTGSVERKRNLRMRKHGSASAEVDKPLTYDDLLKQLSEIEKKINIEEKNLERLRTANKPVQQSDADTDDLDTYMSSLGKQGQSMAQKAEISQSKMNIQKLKTELSKVQRLADIARPAHLPPLIKHDEKKMAVKVGSNSVVYGKRIRLKEDVEKRPKAKPVVKKEEEVFVEEMDSDEETSAKAPNLPEDRTKHIEEETKKSKQDKDSNLSKQENVKKETENIVNTKEGKKVYGPMRPPDDYVIPENYFDQETDRDLPEIMEK